MGPIRRQFTAEKALEVSGHLSEFGDGIHDAGGAVF
jgi:hypothetical protein